MTNQERLKSIETLVSDCYIAHQESIIVQLIAKLEQQYDELATLSTMGQYEKDWTHKKVLDYITFET